MLSQGEAAWVCDLPGVTRRRNRLRKATRMPRAAPGMRRRRQRTAASSSASAFRQPARCRRPSSNPNTLDTRFATSLRRAKTSFARQTLQARKIVPKALPNLILELHVPHVANRLAGVQQNFWGLYAKVTMGRSCP